MTWKIYIPNADLTALFWYLWHLLKSESETCSVVSDYLQPCGSSVHGILQARILEWVALPFCRGSSPPEDQTWVSCIASRFVTVWATWDAQVTYYIVINWSCLMKPLLAIAFESNYTLPLIWQKIIIYSVAKGIKALFFQQREIVYQILEL